MDVTVSPVRPDQRLYQSIAQRFLQAATYARTPNFESINADDVKRLFELYDAAFFDGQLSAGVVAATQRPLALRLSSRMTRAGGKTSRYYEKVRVNGQPARRLIGFEIAISTRLLFLSFDDEANPVRIGGLTCAHRLDGLQRVMEHEIVHLYELLRWGESSCRKPRFRQLVHELFGHVESHHELVTPVKAAAARHGVRLGATVGFTFRGRRLSGMVNNINRRATVLVESAEGPRYSNGKRYEKYYVPLAALEVVD